jgi:hypothetical protein
MAYTYDLRRLLGVALIFCLVGSLSGCNTSPTRSGDETQYRVQGLLVQNLNVDSASYAARFYRNDTAITNASIRFAGQTMGYYASYRGILGAYQAWVSPADGHAGADGYLRVADGSRFTDSLRLSTVGAFTLTDNFFPPNHQIQGTTNYVSLEWTAAESADGYVVAAVKATRDGTGGGYSAAVTSVGVAATIPAEAFMDPDTDLPDTGLYNIYVYAFNDAPDSALASKFLPVPLPAQTADNVARSKLTGRFGTIMVALKDTVRVLSR